MLIIKILLFVSLLLFLKEMYTRYIQNETPTKHDIFYRTALFVIAVILSLPLLYQMLMGQNLNYKARILSEQDDAVVYCDKVSFSNHIRHGGYANPETKEMWLKYPYCSEMKAFLSNPDKFLSQQRFPREMYALHVFTHETMHVRGEYDEAKTECQAVQRNYRAGILMGLSEQQAQIFAVRFYKEIYPKQPPPYYSEKCKPGGEYDENLADSTWQFL